MESSFPTYRSYKTWFFHHIFQHKGLLFLNLLGITIVTFSRTIIPITLGDIVDNILNYQGESSLFTLLLIVLILYIIKNVADYGTMMAGHYLGLKTEKNMRQEFFDSIQQKPLRYHDSMRTGDLLALATNDLRIINNMISHGSFYLYPFIQVIIAFILEFELLNLQLALISIPFFILYFYFVNDYRIKLIPYSRAGLIKHSDLTTVLQDNISGAKIIRAFSSETIERRKFKEVVRAYRDNWIGENRVQSRFYALLILYIAMGTLFLTSVFLVLQQKLTIGELAATNLLFIALIEPTDMIFWATKDMISGFAASSRLFTALSKEQNTEPRKLQSIAKKEINGHIEFQNVSFTYTNPNGSTQQSVLKNLNFIIDPNQRIALVGPTGCGKTTLAKLILRLYDPQEGKILLDGQDLSQFSLEEIRKNIGYIEQDIFLFSRSISDNIRFGKPEASNEEIYKVAKLAYVDDFVQNFPEKYNTIVGERGTHLSGGEKQRVAIARALLINPSILILDDSMSAIDSETEEKIGKAIDNIFQNRTTFIITHRLHTIRTSDWILVLKHGEIVAQGRHEDLIRFSEDYRRIFGKHVNLPPIEDRFSQGG